jgi:hypothetical protein
MALKTYGKAERFTSPKWSVPESPVLKRAGISTEKNALGRAAGLTSHSHSPLSNKTSWSIGKRGLLAENAGE